MKRVKNLYKVEANVLPARVMVLLSKFSQIIKDKENIVIQLSSLNVFKHVHTAYVLSTHSEVHQCYKLLLREVNRHLAEGNMNARYNDKAKNEISTEQASNGSVGSESRVKHQAAIKLNERNSEETWNQSDASIPNSELGFH